VHRQAEKDPPPVRRQAEKIGSAIFRRLTAVATRALRPSQLFLIYRTFNSCYTQHPNPNTLPPNS
jgi:hypothetical protein